MREWIQGLLSWLFCRRSSDDWLESLPCLKTATRGDLRMRVLHTRKRCGHLGCLVLLSLPQGDEWIQVGLLAGEDIPDSIWLLNEAVRCMDGIHECAPEPESN